MNEFVLEISAFIICLFCLVDCLKNRSGESTHFPKGWTEKLKNRRFIYIALLIFLMISAVSDVLGFAVENLFSGRSDFMVDVINEIYFLAHTFLPGLFALYIIDFAGAADNKGKGFFLAFITPFLIAEAVVITNPFTRLIYYIDENGAYARGNCIVLLYICAGIYVLVGLLSFIFNKKRMSKMDLSAMLVILFIATSGIVIQGLFTVTVELFFESVALLCFLLFLEGKTTSDGKKKAER